ncbi:nucleotidyltransferase family protein [candidate division WOR-3 bacterium]|nr:nucleotidyltransferase family protein [candidate division WOR-3 bacterium]
MYTCEQIKAKIKPVLRKHGVIRAALFGSTARNQNNDNSDIDVLVQFEEGKSLLDLIGLKFELEKTFESKIDLLTYDSVHPKLKDSIYQEQVLIYA